MSTMRAAMGLGPSPAPTTGSDALSWSERWDGALCPQIGDPDLWFTETPKARAEAKRICRECPLIADCRIVSDGEKHGIWAAIDLGEPVRLKNAASADASRARKRENERTAVAS